MTDEPRRSIRGEFLERFAEIEELLDLILSIYLSRPRFPANWRTIRLRSKAPALLYSSLLPKLGFSAKIQVIEDLLVLEGIKYKFPDLIKRLHSVTNTRNLVAHRRMFEYINVEWDEHLTIGSTTDFVMVTRREFGDLGEPVPRGKSVFDQPVQTLFESLEQLWVEVVRLGDHLGDQ